MTDTQPSCASGCTYPGDHHRDAPPCTCPTPPQQPAEAAAGGRPAAQLVHAADCHRTTCGGCKPRPARHGQLCHRCHTRARTALGYAEPHVRGLDWAITWLTALSRLPPGGGRPATAGAVTAWVPGPSAPIRIGVLDALTAITADLRHATGNPNPVAAVEHLRRHLLVWEETDQAADIVTTLTRAWRAAYTVAPWTSGPRHLDGVPCPQCLCTALAVQPGEIDAECLECGHTLPAEHYERWLTYAVAEWGDLLRQVPTQPGPPTAEQEQPAIPGEPEGVAHPNG